jgi:hypothetical protein
VGDHHGIAKASSGQLLLQAMFYSASHPGAVVLPQDAVAAKNSEFSSEEIEKE